ncbi:SAM-dependent methyltransferase [Nostoc sp. 'Peltigera membranacea cyanobiont' 210A]|uniref:class I SAM-dependent methyltransferase n=1 Tax=Nostoc sp. 'Peltigera membranacea cyanobiont' 210A TaxID=2014529 RepID=UPI000B959D5F|nr:class I SAM-dependent methyltransferase [Nostoc sp. 'Peltigera membranacea cyanobiont' 210A]OYD95687.1 SAM-dependent methyltransferase [Nostoc sp. 'Peltigera membranacea cyanobiont' 210A]
MVVNTFDRNSVFEEDYLYFYETLLTPERTQHEVDLICRLLDFKAGMNILDLACGHGRIANQLAARGYDVTGLDATAFFLEKAKQDAASKGIKVEYLQGDMRSLPFSNRFNYIINCFTAFGYFDDDENRSVLTEAYRALKVGGKLLIDIYNFSRVLQEFTPELVTEREGNYMLARTRYDALTNRTYTERIIIRDGQVRRGQYFVRNFTFPEIRDWLLQTGFSEVEGYGYDGESFALDSRRMIVVASK